MGGFGSGRFGRRSNRNLDIDFVRVSMTDLVKAGLLARRPSRSIPKSTPLEVELNGTDDSKLAARLSLGTSTGTSPWSFPPSAPTLKTELSKTRDTTDFSLSAQLSIAACISPVTAGPHSTQLTS